ncbi:hypothetical protein LptCag_0293 [Leptospirillum ferriphilum]|uniref:Uncharacterized protein n=1 Tax=Leptospirillum ferriphilum TaxID=178606 RepID=A0A094WC51_9BACT|nr:hypothetical protein LptCag_0293 [Leptospirillum ferriphilum]
MPLLPFSSNSPLTAVTGFFCVFCYLCASSLRRDIQQRRTL